MWRRRCRRSARDRSHPSDRLAGWEGGEALDRANAALPINYLMATDFRICL
jgi:hypothetical protein